MEKLRKNTKRISNDTAGFVLIIAGLLLSFPGVPGPGLLIILFGLTFLARNYSWAKKPLDKVRSMYKKTKDRIIPRS